MKSALLLLISGVLVFSTQAQTAQDEIYADLHLSASNYRAYPEPENVQYTPAPKGYKPFYISTYARHGSRYLSEADQYLMPLEVLQKAKQADKLTPLGNQALFVVDSMARMAQGRYGELTSLGVRQHRGIAERMYLNYPEVFVDGAEVNAKSTIVVRCILSMTAECLQLQSMNPKLHFFNDASQHDMYYMNNLRDESSLALRYSPGVRKAYAEMCARYQDTGHLMKALFTDSVYVRRWVDDTALMNALFDIASNMQSHDTELDLYPIFTKEECYKLWLCNNYNWYMSFASSPITENKIPYEQRNLLRNFLETADTCIVKKNPGATLRFGHEVCVLPFAALLELDNWAKSYESPEELAENWRNYRIFPMACNIQWIFYRNSTTKDVLVKILLNEQEMRLPLQSDIAPYYTWKDVKAYYEMKLASFKPIDFHLPL